MSYPTAKSKGQKMDFSKCHGHTSTLTIDAAVAMRDMSKINRKGLRLHQIDLEC
jgi:hypothetical protein